MKILILNSILFTAENGVIPKMDSIKDTMIYGMCKGFIQLGHEVTLAAAEEYKPTKEEDYEFEVLFFKSSITKLLPPSMLPFSKDLYSYLSTHKEDFDLVISSEVFSFQSLFASMLFPKKTLIWQELTVHQRKFHQLPSKIWHNTIAKIFMSRVVSVIPRSTDAQSFIKKYLKNVSPVIVDHGIDTSKFDVSKNKNRQVISSSQLIYRKNVDGIINIFNEFHKDSKYADIQLLIAGRGEYEETLRKLVKDLCLDSNVKFLGFLPQKELNNYIRKSMAFLVNTRRDLNMVSIPEAIVSGTPILTNMQPSSSGYIKDNELGIARDNWSEEDLKSIIDDNERYVANCIIYREKLTNVHSAKTMIDIYYTANANTVSK